MDGPDILATQEAAEATVETLRVIEHPMARSAELLVDVCSYAGTGNVLKVQQMLQVCSEHSDSPKKEKGEESSAAGEEAPNGAAADGPASDVDGDVAMSGQGEATDAAASTSTAANGAEGSSSTAPADAGTDAKESDTPKSLKHQAIATIGIALIAMGEDVGAEMALRHFQHLVSKFLPASDIRLISR